MSQGVAAISRTNSSLARGGIVRGTRQVVVVLLGNCSNCVSKYMRYIAPIRFLATVGAWKPHGIVIS